MKGIVSVLLAVVFVCSLATAWPVAATLDEPDCGDCSNLRVRCDSDAKVSRPGVYGGYSEVLYDEWVVSSQYVEVRDATKLAVDIFRPAVDGQPVDTPYPVVWQYVWGTRALYTTGGAIQRAGTATAPLTRYGYVVAVVDARGTGASYGQMIGSYSRTEAIDTYDLTEWFAAQPWCDGNVGMFGCSHSGQIEYMALSMQPPHLKAVMPQCFSFDYYFGKVQGGIPGAFRTTNWYERDKTSVPVDEDPTGSMLAEAVEQHKNNPTDFEVYGALPFRDSYSVITGSQMWIESSPGTYLQEIEGSGVPVYQWGNWNDFLTKVMREVFIFEANLENVKKTGLGPLGHCQWGGFDLLTEARRWFDYWLKGIDNGIMDEPPIYYFTRNAPAGEEWRFTWQWPLPNEKQTTYYFGGGPSGSPNTGVNDGILSLTAPVCATGQDDYNVDYGITAANRDARGLTYTTSALEDDVELTGYPQVHLCVSSTNVDGDFFVFLEDVSPTGATTVVTQLQLRASHRTLGTPPFDNLGQPWHRHFQEDAVPLTPYQPVELVPDPLPISYIFPAGHHIRVTITCAYPGATFLRSSPPPVVTVYRNAVLASYISLPVTTEPIAPTVEIDPETLNVKSNGVFTAYITPPEALPKGYRAEDIDISTVKCNGAPALRGRVEDGTLVVKFNVRDLVGVPTGKEVTLTVTGEFYYGIPFKGSDTIRVISK